MWGPSRARGEGGACRHASCHASVEFRFAQQLTGFLICSSNCHGDCARLHINNAAIPCPKTALSARVFRTWMALVGGVVDETNASLVVFGFWFFGFRGRLV